MIPRYSVVLLIFIHHYIHTSSAEECPHSDIVMANGKINNRVCSPDSNCPALQFVEGCTLNCHFRSETGVVKCLRVNGKLVTQDPSGILLNYITTTPAPTTLTTTASELRPSSLKVTYWPITEAHSTITPVTPATSKLTRTQLIIILGVCCGAVVVVTGVVAGVALWFRNRKTKVLPITPSKPRTKPNEPI